ncbi:Uncharacterised protein [uncultured archaeon]|nr:Uncharacterised protein [uncultured archaeon]
MDTIFGSIIDDYTLFRTIDGLIIILILVAVYIGIQITLTWKFLNVEADADEIISDKGSFYRNTLFIFIAGFFMIIHEFSEGFGKNAPDPTTNKFFELAAFLGLVLFMVEWLRILGRLKRKKKALK